MKNKKDNIYVYIWEKYNTIYIGRTINPKSRHYQHKKNITETTYKFSKENNIEHPKMIIIESNLSIEEGVEREKFWIKYYKEQTNYFVLNKTKGGEVGTDNFLKWTKEAVFEESKKYKTRAELKYNNGSVYTVARKNGWLNELFGEIKNIKPIRKWTKEAVFEESKKYKTRYEFQKYNESAYKVALKNGWLDEMEWLIVVVHYTKWTKEVVFEESKKYSYKSEFRKNNYSAYKVALKNKWLDEMYWIKQYVKWTKEAVFEESKKYKHKCEFKKESNRAYKVALKNKWLDEMYWLVPYSKYTKEDVFKESKKYTSRNQFKKNSSLYQIALRNKWIDEMDWLITNKNN